MRANASCISDDVKEGMMRIMIGVFQELRESTGQTFPERQIKKIKTMKDETRVKGCSTEIGGASHVTLQLHRFPQDMRGANP